MDKTRKLNLLGLTLLLLATISWGSSFLILKKTIEKVPGFFVISVRFLSAGIILGAIFFKRIKKLITKRSFYHGIVMGAIVGLAYFTQTWGLKYTTPSHNAFLTATYCVMCPFLYWLISKRKPKIYNLISACLCLVGIGIISFLGQNQESSNMVLGDFFTLISAVFYSLQIIFIESFQEKGSDPIVLLVFTFFSVGIILAICWLCFELPVSGIEVVLNMGAEQWLSIAYLTLSCTLFAQMAQIYGQRFTTANQSAIVLSLEAVFGTLFSVLFGYEKLTLMLVIGFITVFVSMLISELRLDPFSALKKRKDAENNDKK